MMEFVLKNRANSYALLVSLPANEAMHVPMAQGLETLAGLGAQFFGTIVLMKLFVLKNPCKQLCIFSVTSCQRSYACPNAQRCKPKLLPAVSHPSTMSTASLSLPPTGPLPKLFPTFSHPSNMSTLSSRSLPTDLFQSYFPRFPIRPPCPRFHLAPKLYFPPFSRPSTMSTLPSCSLPTELSPSYFPQFPIRPRCPRFRLAPSERSSPQAMIFSHGFPSVVHTSISLLPMKLPPSYFPRFPVRPPCRCFHLVPSQPISARFSIHPRWPRFRLAPSQRSSPYILPLFPVRPPCRRFHLAPSKLSPSHAFPIRPRCPRFRLAPSQQTSPQVYFPPFPVRPPCLRFYLAPSQRSSPQAISHGFPSVHPVVASISLPPNGALPKLFPTVSRPSTLSSLPSRSTKLFPTVPSVHLVVASVSLPPRESKLNEHRRCFEEEYNMS